MTRLAAIPITPRNNPRPIPVLNRIPRIEPDRGLIGGAADEKVVGAVPQRRAFWPNAVFI